MKVSDSVSSFQVWNWTIRLQIVTVLPSGLRLAVCSSVLIAPPQALLKHKVIRGAKRTAILTQLVARYHKYAEVVPESDSDGERAPADGEARRCRAPAGFPRAAPAGPALCEFFPPLPLTGLFSRSAEDESVVARRGQHSDEERDASDEGAWDYSTLKPSDRAEALPPAPKVACFLCLFVALTRGQVVTPAAKAARTKKKKKRADGGGSGTQSNADTPSPAGSPVVGSPLAREAAAAAPAAAPVPGASGGGAERGLGVAEDKKSSALTSIVYPALSGLLEAQLAGGVKASKCFSLSLSFPRLSLSCAFRRSSHGASSAGQERSGGAAEDCL